MANQGEYVIKLHSFIDNKNNTPNANTDVDILAIGKVIEESFNKSLKSIESSIGNVIVGALKKVLPDTSGVSGEYVARLATTITNEVKGTLSKSIESYKSSDKSSIIGKRDIEKDIVSSISDTLVKRIEGLLKSKGSEASPQKVVKEIVSNISTKEAADLVKVLHELSILSKDNAALVKLMSSIAAKQEKGKEVDIPAIKNVVNTGAKNVLKASVTLDTKEAEKELSALSKKAEIEVKVDVDTKDAEKALSNIKGTDLTFDIETKSIPVLLKQIDKLRKEIDQIKGAGLAINIDMKLVDELEERLSSLAKNFNHMKAALGKEINNAYTSANKRSNSPEQRAKERNRIPVLESRLEELHTVQDRLPEKRHKKEVNPRTDFYDTAGPIRSYKEQLKKGINMAVTIDTISKKDEAIKDIFAIEKLIPTLNAALSSANTSADKNSEAIARQTSAIQANTEATKAATKSTTKTVEIQPKSKSSDAVISDMKSMMSTFVKGYSAETIRPNMDYGNKKTTNAFDADVYKNMTKLSKSLDDLQRHIYSTMSKGLDAKRAENSYINWAVVEKEGRGPNHNRAFNLKDRQWSMDIVNVEKLKSLTGKEGTPKQLLDSYVKKLANEKFANSNNDALISEISQWLKSNIKNGDVSTLTSDIKQVLGDDLVKKLGEVVGSKNITKESISNNFKNVDRSSLLNIHAYTSGANEINKALTSLKRTIAIPAAKITNSGNPIIETTFGGQRSAMQTADYKTGHERAFDVYLKNKTNILNRKPLAERNEYIKSSGPELLELSKAVRTFSPGKKETDRVLLSKDFKTGDEVYGKTYEEISRQLVKGLALDIDPKKTSLTKLDIAEIYKQAAVPIGIERQRITKGTSKPLNAIEESKKLQKLIDSVQSSSSSSEEFVSNMYNQGISATKVVKSLDTISFSNMYDTIGKAISPNLDSIVANIATSTGAVNDLEKTIGRLEGLMPVVDQSSPRRGMHQGSVVTALFNNSSAYNMDKGPAKTFLGDLEPAYTKALEEEHISSSTDTKAKKSFITDFNRRANELFFETKVLKESGSGDGYFKNRKNLLKTGDVQQLSSLGLPESTASGLSDADRALNVSGRTLPMYTGDLRKLSPFGTQFQQTGRNISNVSSAKGYNAELFGATSVGPEFPTLRSNTENDVIRAGRFGKTGYGYNVLAELGHTAGNFEDQILVSGKLADAVTSAVKTLVRPKEGASATKITEGDLKGETLGKAVKEIINIMGIPEQYEGRADKAFLSEVANVININKGEETEVQTTKLAELFINHFGRKLTTRYGSKGVAITPTNANTLGGIMAANSDKKVKVLTEDEKKKAGLGVALMPKSMGEMAAEIISDAIASDKDKKSQIESKVTPNIEELLTQLKNSGNKFLLEVFTDSKQGLVTDEEATTNEALFKQVQQAFSILGTSLNKNESGIDKIKTMHKGSKTVAKPIDVRLSSYGAAKRGLQTEALELVTNNLAGTSVGTSTILKDSIAEKDIPKLLGKGKSIGLLSKYSKALGYQGADLSKEDESITDAAKKAYIDLEKRSNFYVEIIDELGKKRKGLVGNKFLSIIENPTQNEEWDEGEIEALSKGLRLNIPAYAAYTSIFGEDSAFMKTISETFTSDQAEHYDNILTYLINLDGQYKEKFAKNLKTIPIKDIKPVSKSKTHTFDKDDPNSLLGTIFDTDKYPEAFKTLIPSTKGADQAREELYIPRSISRSTFMDPTVAGGYGLKASGSKLQDVLDKSGSLDAFYNLDSSTLLDSDVNSMASAFGPRVLSSLKYKRLLVDGKDNPSANKKSLDTVKNGFMTVLDDLNRDNKLSDEEGTLSPEVVKFFNSAVSESEKQYTYKGPDSQKAFYDHLKDGAVNSSGGLNAMKNLLTGAGKGSRDMSVLARATDRETKLSIMEGMSNAVGNKRLPYEIGKSSEIGPDGARRFISGDERYAEQIKQKQAKLEESKKAYLDSLQNILVGKRGAVDITFFTRNIPAVLAKATNATVDKVDDLQNFSKALGEVDGLDLSNEISKMGKITEEHAANVAKYREMGMPVLKQHEIGMSEKFAEKLKASYVKKYDENTGKAIESPELKKGSLKDLVNYADTLRTTASKRANPTDEKAINEYIEKELAPYVESVRFPFTGTSSLKPYKARVLESNGISDDVFQVPGVPEMDMSGFQEVYDSIKDKIDQKTIEREKLREKGDDTGADALTVTIDKLNTALSNVLPKYLAHAQKLDYDGDQIELHTADNIDARKDIARHFNLLLNDKNSTAGKFGDFYAGDAKQPSQGDKPLAFMAAAFNKKFDTSKGFSFLEKPFMTEDLQYLTNKEKIGVLAGKDQDMYRSSDLDAVNNVMAGLFEKLGEDYKRIVGLEDLSSAAEAAAKMLDDLSSKDAEKGAFAQGYLKEELLNTKLDTAVNAQLFKINTGPDVESMTRLMRAFESKHGFGGGELALNDRVGTGKLDSDFFVRERNTQLNEFFRFAVQKGMDVKHAGEQPVAGELVTGLTSGPVALRDLISKINEGKGTYKDLKTFKDINEDALRSTLGRFSTKELKTYSNVGESSDVSRKDLVDGIVKRLGFEGFLRDMQRTIEEIAIENIPSVYPKAKDPKKYLERRYEQGKGINVGELITKQSDPLYKFRTDSYEPPEGSGFYEDFKKSLVKSVSDTRGRSGAYSELVRGFSSLPKIGVDSEAYDSVKATLASNPLTKLADNKEAMSDISSKMSAMENRLGLAPVTDSTRNSLLNTKFYADNSDTILDTDSEEEKATKEGYNRRLAKAMMLAKRFERISSMYSAEEVPRSEEMIQPEGPPISTTRDNKEAVNKSLLAHKSSASLEAVTSAI